MISVIIPTFGDRTRVNKLLKSIHAFEKEPFETIIVNDNPNSRVEPAYRAKYLQNAHNLGFAATVNRGLSEAKGDILLLLNDDIVFTGPNFALLNHAFAKDPTIGIVGALLRYPKGTIQHGGMEFNAKTKSFQHIKTAPFDRSFCIAVTGAFFAISRACYEKLGGLDDSFFLACEDTQYCLDAWKSGFKVYFEKKLKATHEEGATRGKTTHEKSKNRLWTKKEAEGIKLFKRSLHMESLLELVKRIRKLNYGNLKIEVGSGFNPHPGFKHLDIRKGLPQLDYVCDFVKDPLPFGDSDINEILANHVIEHIPFRKLTFVISEWARVLEDGGKLTLRTPNLKFICENYLANKTTPEYPSDEEFIRNNLSLQITPAWWANLKLFSGQDYSSNFHHVCFDFEMLRVLLNRFGFGFVKEEKFDKEFSPGELQVVAYKGVPIESKGPITLVKKKSCLVIRDGALGDVILTTPIVNRLLEQGYHVSVKTKIPQVFDKYYDKPVAIWQGHHENFGFYKVIDLNLAYENRPKMHIIDAYSEVAFGDHDTPHICKLYEDQKPKENYIILHQAKSWENRTLSADFWVQLDAKLQNENIKIVGKGSDFSIVSLPKFPRSIEDLVGKQDFWELVETIQKAKLFVGMDSGPLHIAQAVGTESVGIFTSALAPYRAHSNVPWIVAPQIECYGCLHEEKPPVTYCGCKRGDFKCLDLITPEIVFEKIKEALNGIK